MSHVRLIGSAAAILAAAFWCANAPSVVAQQQGPVAQPGTTWTEDQLRAAVAPARVGRKLTPRSWPNNARVAVCLGFDVDNESYLLARGEKSPTTLSAADFGAQTGTRADPGIAGSSSGSSILLHPGGERHPPSRR